MYNDLNPFLRWDFIKYRIRITTIKYSKIKAKERRQYEKNLLRDIAFFEESFYLSNSVDDYNALSQARNKLQHLYDFKFQVFDQGDIY